MIVFVYGTLMRGQANHAQMRGCTYLGDAATEPAYTLHDLGAYPAMAVGGATRVAGELFGVPEHQVPRLDAFEDVPALYRRVPVMLEGGAAAEGYVMEAPPGPVIASGDWRLTP